VTLSCRSRRGPRRIVDRMQRGETVSSHLRKSARGRSGTSGSAASQKAAFDMVHHVEREPITPGVFAQGKCAPRHLAGRQRRITRNSRSTHGPTAEATRRLAAQNIPMALRLHQKSGVRPTPANCRTSMGPENLRCASAIQASSERHRPHARDLAQTRSRTIHTAASCAGRSAPIHATGCASVYR